jgi:predicted DNA-binding transcriptional regulator YafY
MRADRLVSLLLLLQRRQRVTAAEAAAELEVSERTARRDLEALSMAGIPVYAERGRGGGWRLVGGARTDLSGLNAAEARALFQVAGPAAAATPQLKSALHKLVRALPDPLREGAEASAAAVVIDPGDWGRNRRLSQPTHLEALQAAIADGVQVRIGYTDRGGRTSVRSVHPLGTVRKATVWYLVAATDEGQRTFRVGRVQSVERTGLRAVRPAGFDLARTWREVVEQVDELRSQVVLEVLVDAPFVDVVLWMFDRQAEMGPIQPDGRAMVTVRGQRLDGLVAQMAGLGGRVEVVAPAEARAHLARLGRELCARYGGGA